MSTLNSFTIYREYYDLITLLSEEEQANVLLAISKYMFDDEEIKLTDRENKVFVNLKRPLQKSKNKSQNANKNKSNQNQNEIKLKSNEDTHLNVYVNVHDNVLEDKGCGEKKPLVTNDVSSLTEITKEILNYLNKKTNSNFRCSSKATQTKINARLNDGYSLNDFIVVIDKKYAEWKGTEFEQYLCPETLFGTKFEKYLNQKIKTNKMPEWFNKDIEVVQASEEEIEKLQERMKR